jgi:PleD family two-component response regulator
VRALAALAALAADLVVLDLELPGGSGFRLLEVLKGLPATPAVPVVTVLVGAAVQPAAPAGADALLLKPLDAGPWSPPRRASSRAPRSRPEGPRPHSRTWSADDYDPPMLQVPVAETLAVGYG